MALIGVTEMFKIYPAKHVHKQKVKVKPNEHYYGEVHGAPYIKYSCPICEQIAIKAESYPLIDENDKHCQFIKFQIHQGMETCPCCGINLDWDYKSTILQGD